MTTVHWRYRALDQGQGTRKNRKKIDLQAIDPSYGGIQNVPTDQMGNGSWTTVAPHSIRHANRTYRFLFWSVYGPGMPAPVVTSGPSLSVGVSGAIVYANAWYVWDFGVGPGAHAVYVDAFSKNTGDFIDDDFVDVSPDDPGNLTSIANETGYVGTGEIEALRITARELHWRSFVFWVGVIITPVASLADPDMHDISVRRGAVLVAFAIYEDVRPSIPDGGPHVLPGSVVLGHAGGPFVVIVQPGVPPQPPPGDPVWQEALAAIRVYEAAARISQAGARREIQRGALQLVAEQVEQVLRSVS